MKLFQRKRVFVDARVQGALFLRIVVYWFAGLVAISQLVLCWDGLQHPDRPFFDPLRLSLLLAQYAPAVIAASLILPLVLYDTLVLTNRFAGPIFRLRRSMRALAAGEEVAPLRFRDGDFWQEVADEFNGIAERQNDLKKQLASQGVPHNSESYDGRQLESIAVD